MSVKQIHARQQVAHEAAKLMVESGIRDYQLAKRKAAVRLGMAESRDLPRNDEIEREREAYQRLFGDEERSRHVISLRKRGTRSHAAARALRSAARGSGAERHGGPAQRDLSASVLRSAGGGRDVPARQSHRPRPGRSASPVPGRRAPAPARVPLPRRRSAGRARGVLRARARRRVPLSPVDGRPMRRAKLAEVAALVEAHV